MPNRQYLSLFAIVGTLLGASVAAGAQTATAPPAAIASPAATVPGTERPHHHGGRMGRALRSLNLSASQQSQIKGLMATYRTSHTSATPESRRQLVAGIENVLTPAQRTQFETAMQRNRHGGGAVASPSPPVPGNPTH